MATEVIVKIIETSNTIKIRQIATAVVDAKFYTDKMTGDNTTVELVLTHPIKAGSLNLTLNGIGQEDEGVEYTLGVDLQTITFVTAPPLGWKVRADYAY